MIDSEPQGEPVLTPDEAWVKIQQRCLEGDKELIGRIGLEAMNAEGFFVGTRGNNLLNAEEWRELFTKMVRGSV